MHVSGWLRSAFDGADQRLDLNSDPVSLDGDGWARLLGGRPPAVPTRGVVYGVALNSADELAALGDALVQPPYKAAPRAPILYIKPANTWAGAFDEFRVPVGVDGMEICAAVAVVLGADATRVKPRNAWGHVAGITLVADLSVPTTSFFRPPVRFKCLDGSCAIGTWVADAASVPNLETRVLEVAVDGVTVQRVPMNRWVRDAAHLIANISSFMTLREGDVLMLGCGPDRPRVTAGQRVQVRCAGIGMLSPRIVREELTERSAKP